MYCAYLINQFIYQFNHQSIYPSCPYIAFPIPTPLLSFTSIYPSMSIFLYHLSSTYQELILLEILKYSCVCLSCKNEVCPELLLVATYLLRNTSSDASSSKHITPCMHNLDFPYSIICCFMLKLFLSSSVNTCVILSHVLLRTELRKLSSMWLFTSVFLTQFIKGRLTEAQHLNLFYPESFLLYVLKTKVSVQLPSSPSPWLSLSLYISLLGCVSVSLYLSPWLCVVFLCLSSPLHLHLLATFSPSLHVWKQTSP